MVLALYIAFYFNFAVGRKDGKLTGIIFSRIYATLYIPSHDVGFIQDVYIVIVHRQAAGLLTLGLVSLGKWMHFAFN